MTGDLEAIEAAALAVLDVEGKIKAVRALTALHQRRQELLSELQEVERQYGAEHAAALRVGWTSEQLGKLGFPEPTRRPRGRPRGKTRQASVKTGGPPTEDASATA
ncbi:hypothetical protein [Actinomadura sp. NBRC 104425]|uniref:hypothetical protein n=1 Tax=Actinomadura sp. NBRC 104425 TaxID=3032204 RepID=UPI002557499D|nr:hypothetical protein [Actinomadura sp. NBRC 104425]